MGRKTYVRRNLTIRKNDSTRQAAEAVGAELDRIRELETENALLRARIADLNRLVDEQVTTAASGLGPDEDDGKSMAAFEAFLAESDPHIERVQRFLLG